MAVRVAVLIVSDSVYRKQTDDASLPQVQSSLRAFNEDNGSSVFEITNTATVPDDVFYIGNQILQWTNTGTERTATDALPHLILTCGGTGFTDTDITPEAVEPLLEKKALGIVAAMLRLSLAVTPFAAISRPVAGVRKGALIVTLPGSPKAVKENLEAVVGVLEHAVRQIGTTSSRSLHGKEFQEKNRASAGACTDDHTHSNNHSHGHTHAHHSHNHGHSHGHNHGLVKHDLISNDYNEPVTKRQRESPYPMVSVTDAFKLISKHTPPPQIITKSINDDLKGYVLAQDVHAPINVPEFPASIVDGYAVISSDGPGVYPVVSISHAAPQEANDGIISTPKLQPGQIARITTGAPVPPGADAIVMVEATQIVTQTDDGKEELEVRILAKNVKPKDNIREIGSDLKKGAFVMQKSDIFTAVGGEVGVLASIGVSEVQVYKKPKIGILSTGDELVDLKNTNTKIRAPLKYGQIYDCNRPALITSLRSRNFDVVDLQVASDSSLSLIQNITSSYIEHDLDYIVTSGGVSMGELDLLKPIIERDLQGTIHFGRVAMKPGKPTTFATVKIPTTKGKSNMSNLVEKKIFALPGNPASAIVTLHLFVYYSLYQFAGHSYFKTNKHCFPSVNVRLQDAVKLDPRPEYHRVYVKQGSTGDLSAYSTGFQRSSRVHSMAKANALLCLPSSSDKGPSLEKGAVVEALVVGDIGGM